MCFKEFRAHMHADKDIFQKSFFEKKPTNIWFVCIMTEIVKYYKSWSQSNVPLNDDDPLKTTLAWIFVLI